MHLEIVECYLDKDGQIGGRNFRHPADQPFRPEDIYPKDCIACVYLIIDGAQCKVIGRESDELHKLLAQYVENREICVRIRHKITTCLLFQDLEKTLEKHLHASDTRN